MNTTEAYNSIKKILLALPEAERHTILGRLSTTMKTHNSSAELLEKCRQSKVADDRMVCPKCGSVTVVRNGRKGGRQRYLCKNCRKSFGDTHGTKNFHSRHSSDTSDKLSSHVVLKRSVRENPRDIHNHKKTALFEYCTIQYPSHLYYVGAVCQYRR